MVYNNFSRYDIDIENETIFSLYYNKNIKFRVDKKGYKRATIKDDNGNKYYVWSHIVYCVSNNITKDQIPEGYEIDHIIPIMNGGDDSPENLRLVTHTENMNNPMTKENLYNRAKPSEETKEKMSKSQKGRKHTEEAKKKISEANKGKHHSEETKKKISDAKKGKYTGENSYWYGKHRSEETRKKLSDARKGKQIGADNPMYGKHHSEVAKKKISDANKGRYLGEKSVRSKKVCQYTPDGKLVKIWSSTMECKRNGYNQGEVAECCRGGRYRDGKWQKRNKYKGYIWKYED